MVAPAAAEGVEVLRLHPAADKIPTGGTLGGNRPRWRDVVGRDAVSQEGQDPRARNVRQRRRLALQIFEEGWVPNIGGVGVPIELLAAGGR